MELFKFLSPRIAAILPIRCKAPINQNQIKSVGVAIFVAFFTFPNYMVALPVQKQNIIIYYFVSKTVVGILYTISQNARGFRGICNISVLYQLNKVKGMSIRGVARF